jgi:dihydropteroate synthase
MSARDPSASQRDPTYLQPDGFVGGAAARQLVAAGEARWLCGGPLAFTIVRELTRGREGLSERALPVSAIRRDTSSIEASRPPFAGLALDRPRILGIVNVTPDSFSDGGRFATVPDAIAHGRALREAGADLLDVGGESTRPGAAPVPLDEELRRVVPVVEALAGDGAIVSIDTRKPAVMRRAIAAGASIVNDVGALSAPEAVESVAATTASVVLMHMQGEPGTMQTAPRYVDAATEVYDFLAERVGECERAGIARNRIAVDPGIGFGKTFAHNLEVLGRLALYHGLGCAVLLGASRKLLVARLSRGEPSDARLPGSIALALHAGGCGVQLVRVHDVAETLQAIRVYSRLKIGVIG